MKYTKEDLMSTWGVIESKEHAEYIVEQCKSAGIISSDTWRCEYGYFSISLNELLFWGDESHANYKGKKQITTIPLPPKEKEWPQVGDEIVLRYKFDSKQVMHTGKLLYLSRDHLIIETAKDNDYHCHRCDWLIEKPKSKQDLLIEELHQKLLANNCSDEYLLACDIVQGKIEGLSYE